jgi:hypothetical protein
MLLASTDSLQKNLPLDCVVRKQRPIRPHPTTDAVAVGMLRGNAQ